MNGVQCYELFGGIALKNHAFLCCGEDSMWFLGIALLATSIHLCFKNCVDMGHDAACGR